MKIKRQKTNHVHNPVGFLLEPVCFSWIVEEARGTCTGEASVQIGADEAFQEILYDSGKRQDINSQGFCPDFSPEPGRRYYWRVQVWDDAGDFCVSAPAYFETALPMKTGKWIQAPFEKNIHPYIRKQFRLREGIRMARLYITGLGLYEAEINGEKVGEEYLAPFYNDYNLWIQYQTYDVTDKLHTGENAVGVMLGNGWYKGRFGFIDKLDCLYGDTMKLIAELHIIYEDGSREIIPSGSDWKCAPSPVLESSIYDGEAYDSRKEIPDWSKASLDEAGFYPAIETAGDSELLTPRLSLPVKVKEIRKPAELIHTKAGEQVLDFGQNMTGWVEFDCEEPEGTEIILQFGEILQEGNFYNENLRTAKEEYRYISNGKKAHVRPHFTFYGFRYMKITGIQNIRLQDFQGCVIYSDMEETGNITTSNPKINRLFQNALWGQKGNFLDTPTDCPQRDERMGWTGDAQVFCATASFNMDTPAFYRKYLYDMKLEQKTLNGSVPHVVPDILGQIDRLMQKKEKDSGNIAVSTAHGSCAWADAATVIPWTLYRFYGDRSLLEEEYENMKAWTDYIRMVDETKCGGRRLWTDGFHFADWLALDNFHKDTCIGATDPYYVASVYYYYSSFLTADAAGILGKEEDAKAYRKLAEEVKQAIQKEYFTETGRIAVDTQTAMVLALYFDLVPSGCRERLKKELKKKLLEEKVHLTTGFVGTAFLCPALAQNGMADMAYTLLLNEDYPSWLYEVNMGATTVWERWNSVLPDGRISDTGMNSLNHYSYGVIVEWMYRYMCGLNPGEEGGFKRFVIKPYVDRRFEWVSMTYQSDFGEIKSAWSYTGEGLLFEVKVPYDAEGEFILTVPGKQVLVNGEPCESLLGGESLKLKKGSYEIRLIL